MEPRVWFEVKNMDLLPGRCYTQPVFDSLRASVYSSGNIENRLKLLQSL